MRTHEARTSRALCAALAALLALGLLAALAAHLAPSHNVESVLLGAPQAREAVAGGEAYAGEFLPTGAVNVNTASAEELTRVTGIGEKLASIIIAEREQNGRFIYPEDLLAVRGIGMSTLKRLLPQITLD